MRQDYDSSASGYLTDSFEGVSRQFTDVEMMSTSEVNVVAKAKRYGRWWLLKGLRKEVAGEAGCQQRLRKELEILMQLWGYVEENVYCGGLAFRVVASKHTRLREGDTFEYSMIVEGEPLYLDNLRQGEMPAIAYICGKKDGVRFEIL